jgi:hypothetical protein
MYNIGKSLSGGTRIPNFKKLVVLKSFPLLKWYAQGKSLRIIALEGSSYECKKSILLFF